MKRKQIRLKLIKRIVRNNSITSQNELAQLLEKEGVVVTQATLSRDLKTLRVNKVPNETGYVYVIPDENKQHDNMLKTGQRSVTAQQQLGFVSLQFSGNLAVIKTRNGYATGLAYDIDMSEAPEVLGTIAGADTVFAILREGVSQEQARQLFSRFIPVDN